MASAETDARMKTGKTKHNVLVLAPQTSALRDRGSTAQYGQRPPASDEPSPLNAGSMNQAPIRTPPGQCNRTVGGTATLQHHGPRPSLGGRERAHCAHPGAASAQGSAAVAILGRSVASHVAGDPKSRPGARWSARSEVRARTYDLAPGRDVGTLSVVRSERPSAAVHALTVPFRPIRASSGLQRRYRPPRVSALPNDAAQSTRLASVKPTQPELNEALEVKTTPTITDTADYAVHALSTRCPASRPSDRPFPTPHSMPR